MPRALEVAYIANTTDLERANTRAIASLKAAVADMTASGAKISASYGEMVASANEAGAAAAKHAAAMGGSLQTQAAAYKSAAAKIGLADDEIAASARMAGESAAKRAAAVGGALADQRAAYVQAAEAAKAEAAAATKAAEEASAAQVAAAGRAAKAAEEQSARISAAAKKIATVGLLVAGAAAYGIKKSADTLAELADETRKLHNVTGLSVQSASAYAAVAKTQEIPVKALNQAFGTLSKNIHAVENAQSGATKGAKTQENAFKQLGLPLSAISKAHGDLNKLLPQITQRFEQLPGSVNKAAIGMALFGRGWQTLVPLMHSGDLGLKEQLKTAERMGATLSGSTTQKLKEFAKQQEDAKYASLGLQLAIGQYVAPALTKLIHFLAETAHSLGDGVKWLQKHEGAAIALAGVISTVLGGALTVFAYSKAKKFVEATQDMVGGLKVLASRMGLTAAAVTAADDTIVADNEAVGASWSLLVPGAALIAASAAAGYELGKHWKEVAQGIEEVAQSMANTVIHLLNELLHKASETAGKLSFGLTPSFGHIGELSGAGQGGESGRGGGESLGKVGKGGIGNFGYLEGTSGAHSRKQAAYLESLGVPSIVAAGLAGNFAQEGVATDTGASGLGIAQWMGSRRSALEAFARATHRKPTDEGAQLEFAAKELQGSYGGTFSRASHARTPQEAARIIAEGYERPAPATANYGHREEAAAGAYRQKHTAAVEHNTAAVEHHTAALTGHAHKATKATKTLAHLFTPHGGTTGFFEAPGANYTHGSEEEIAARLDKLGKALGVKLTGLSGYRTPSHSVAVGGFANDPHTRGEASDTPGTERISEAVLRKFGLTRPFPGAKEADHIQLLPGVTSLRKAANGIQLAAAEVSAAIKQTLAQLVTPAQQHALHAHVEAAGMDRGEATAYGGFAGDVGSYLQGAQTKWGRQKLNLANRGDAALQKARDEAPIYAAQAQKKYYQREVKALQAEAREWGKIRDSYRRFARHATGPGAKKEALKKAAEFDGKVEQAQKEAAELGGTIAGLTETEDAARETLAGLPGEVQGADLAAYQAANAHVDLEERAGLLSPEQAKAAREGNAKKALEGGFGELSAEGKLQIQGDLREFQKALESATAAQEANTNVLKEATKVLNEFNQASGQLKSVELATVSKALADLISGQIGGRPGVYTAAGAAGGAARY